MPCRRESSLRTAPDFLIHLTKFIIFKQLRFRYGDRMGDKDIGKAAVQDALKAAKVRNCKDNTIFCISSDESVGLSYSSD